MRLITRNDASLAVALIASTIVIFQQPLRWAFDLANDMQQRYHVDLLPALTILTCVYVFHESRKRQQAKADARAAAAEAAAARLRSAELERLMAFSEALANALDPAALQQVLWRHLPTFARDHDCWMLLRNGSRWEPFLYDRSRTAADALDSIEASADRVLAEHQDASARVEGVVDESALCFSLIAGGSVVGMLGVRQAAAMPAADRRAIGAAAAVMAIAIRNVQVLLSTQEEGMRDGLTGCATRKHGLESLERAMRLARRSGRPLSVVMFDIDRFKGINDQFGHTRGDELLRGVGQLIARVLRSTDTACRYGGDEFLVVCPDTPLLGAQQVAECLRREIADLEIGPAASVTRVTSSFGVAAALPGELDPTALVERADAALYLAKGAGRNRFRIANAG